MSSFVEKEGPPKYFCGIFGPSSLKFKVVSKKVAYEMKEFYSIFVPAFRWVIFEIWP